MCTCIRASARESSTGHLYSDRHCRPLLLWHAMRKHDWHPRKVGVGVGVRCCRRWLPCLPLLMGLLPLVLLLGCPSWGKSCIRGRQLQHHNYQTTLLPFSVLIAGAVYCGTVKLSTAMWLRLTGTRRWPAEGRPGGLSASRAPAPHSFLGY